MGHRWIQTKKKPPKAEEPVLMMWFNRRLNGMDLGIGFYTNRNTWILVHPVTGSKIIPNGPVVAWRKIPWAGNSFFSKMVSETKKELGLEESE